MIVPELALSLFFFVLACIFLVKSAGILADNLTKVSSYFGLNEFAIGFIIMALSTSIPELFVGIMSAIEGNTALALGNVIGSNIADLTIIIGLVVLFTRSMRIRSKIIRKDLVYMLIILIVPMLLMLWPPTWMQSAAGGADAVIGRFEGFILICVFVWYLYLTLKQEKKFHREIRRTSKTEARAAGFLTVLAIVVLMVSAHFVVEYGTSISEQLSVPPILIGIFLLGLGTSLPELSFEIKAVAARHEEMALGDLIGSVITNSTLVLGVTALIAPVTANFFLFFTSAMWMIVISFIFLTFAESDGGINWKEAISLVMMYVLFVIVESYIKTLQG